MQSGRSNRAADQVGNGGQDPRISGSSGLSPASSQRSPTKKVTLGGPSSPAIKDSGELSNQEERAELAQVLSSEMFRRSPKLSRLLTYLCEKYFNGESGELKEYSIAVDVLGRDTEFDPQLNAVVRVDTHHLRKRLKQYYSVEGASHPIQIVLPNGQYTPMFVRCAELTQQIVPQAIVAELGDETLALPIDALKEQEVRADNGNRKTLMVPAKWQPYALLLVLAVAVALLYTTAARSKDPGVGVKDTNQGGRSGTAKVGAENAAAVIASPAIAAPQFEGIRILAGDRSGNYTDKAGRLWLSDRYFTGGTTFHRASREIERTFDPDIFRTGREGQFAYEIPLSPGGPYELRLYFAETGVESEALRSVSLAINGLPISTLDVASDAGGVNTATMKIFKDISPAKDGLLHLTFQGSGPSFVNAVEVLPGTAGRMLPIRLSTRDTVYRDHEGQIWMPDQYFLGGRRSSRTSPIEGTPDPDLYMTQRYGHFTYAIPVVEGGQYRVALHFAETWFNPNSVGGVGSRVFDVYCNGTTLLKNFDILKETAGIANRPVVKVFHHVQASPQGKLNLTFVPINNYALLTALEVSQE